MGCGHKASKSTMKSAPKNWGGMKMPKKTTSPVLGSANHYGAPKVKMNFSGKSRRSY
jgi:hypothetical protein